MTKQTIKILGSEAKTTKNNKQYYSYKCDNQEAAFTASCFDSKVYDELNKRINEFVSIELSQGEFTNITAFYGPAPEIIRPEEFKGTEPKPSSRGTEPKPSYRDTAFYVSYAKDLIVSGKTVKEAIKAVQELKEAFS